MRPTRHPNIWNRIKRKLGKPRPEALPWIGLGVDHGLPGNPNLKAREWALKQLEGLRRRGYTRAVIEGGDEFFDPLAKRARGMGYTVERESKVGHRAQGRIRDGGMAGLSGRMAYIRSQYITNLTLRHPKTVLLAGARHLLHAEDYILPYRSPRPHFEVRYFPEVNRTVRELARLDWEDFCRAATRREKRQNETRAKKAETQRELAGILEARAKSGQS